MVLIFPFTAVLLLIFLPLPGYCRLRRVGIGLITTTIYIPLKSSGNKVSSDHETSSAEKSIPIRTLQDAIEVCALSRLSGWPLVAFAKEIVHKKFEWYSTINFWDTPDRAFEHGVGYCSQYNSALFMILKGVNVARGTANTGFQSKNMQLVSSFRVSVHDDPDWVMGHTWVRVRINGESEVQDICAHSLEPPPGPVGFTPIWPVFPSPLYSILLLLHIGFCLFSATVEIMTALHLITSPRWALSKVEVVHKGRCERNANN